MEMLGLVLPIFAIMVTGFVFQAVEDCARGPCRWPDPVRLLRRGAGLADPGDRQEQVAELARWGLYASFGGAIAAVFVIVLAGTLVRGRRGLGEAAMVAYVCTAANTGFVALPVLHATIGHKAILPAAIATIILVVLMLVAMVLLERGSSRSETSAWPQVKRTLRNPIVLASVVGIGWAIGGVRFPAVVISYLELLADALAPCALFAIGLSLRLDTVRSDAATIAFCTLVKLLVMPALVLLLVRWVDLPPVFAIAAVVCAAVPTAKVSYVLADQYRIEKALVAEVISVTTSVSVLTLIGWLFLLGHLYPGVFGAH